VGQQNVIAAAVAACLAVGCGPRDPEAAVRAALARGGAVSLPAGDLVIAAPLRVVSGTTLTGSAGSRVVAARNFEGAALILAENVSDVTFSGFELDGNRDALEQPLEMAPPENAFRVWYAQNGILADRVANLRIERVRFRKVVNFPVLVSRSSRVRILNVAVEDSGSLNAAGRNNLSGGILIEEGTQDFEVRGSAFRNIRGNALWTHSLFTSPRLQDGVFAGNRFETVGRDAIQVGHAKRVAVEDNVGMGIGYPVEIVDVEHGGTPVAIDTAGDVEGAQYVRNQFLEVNGKCIDLDGFHDGVVRDNQCVNRSPLERYPHGHFGIVMNNTHPDAHSRNIELRGNVIDGARYGGLFLMGSHHRVAGNRFLNVNRAGCPSAGAVCAYKPEEPRMLSSGIYLGRGVARKEPTAENVIRDNTVTGRFMSANCIVLGPDVAPAANTIENNDCREAEER
jgi:hypothetical protein